MSASENDPIEQPRRATVEQAIDGYRTFWGTLLQEADPFWFEVDLTISQIKCLVTLALRKDITIGGIGNALGLARPSASLLVEQLVRAHHATRTEDPADRRRTLVRLTAKGQDLADRLLFDKEDLMAAAFATLQPDDLAALTVGFKALAAAMKDTAR